MFNQGVTGERGPQGNAGPQGYVVSRFLDSQVCICISVFKRFERKFIRRHRVNLFEYLKYGSLFNLLLEVPCIFIQME